MFDYIVENNEILRANIACWLISKTGITFEDLSATLNWISKCGVKIND